MQDVSAIINAVADECCDDGMEVTAESAPITSALVNLYRASMNEMAAAEYVEMAVALEDGDHMRELRIQHIAAIEGTIAARDAVSELVDDGGCYA